MSLPEFILLAVIAALYAATILWFAVRDGVRKTTLRSVDSVLAGGRDRVPSRRRRVLRVDEYGAIPPYKGRYDDEIKDLERECRIGPYAELELPRPLNADIPLDEVTVSDDPRPWRNR